MLPGELRNRIYELALGTHWLHVSRDGSTVQLCQKPSRFCTRRDLIKSSPTRQKFVAAYAHHPECHRGKSLPLDLLIVCRQVYLEARLIPFSANIFVFERRSALMRFLEIQREERSLALRSLLLGYLLDVDHESHRLLARVERMMVFALLFDRAEYRLGQHSHTATFTSLREHLPFLKWADVCLEFCASASVGDWDFRRAEANIEDYLTGGVPLSDRSRKLLG